MHDANLLEDQPIAWTPTPDVIERAQLTRFMRQVGVSTWDELYELSIRDVEKFTEEVLKFLDIKFDPPYEKLLDTTNGVEFPKWLAAKSEPGAIATGFPTHAGLNITTMCLDRWQTNEMKDQPAVIYEAEDGSNWHKTYEELFIDVESVASGLRFNGLGKGDAIAIHLPMIIETVTALLAINRIGAIAVPVFSGYGVEAIASRLNAVEAKALFTSESYERRGKSVSSLEVAKAAVDRCPTIQKVICCTSPWSNAEFPDDRYISWNDLSSYQFMSIAHDEWQDLQFAESTSAEDPLIILYTSGTTGKPKGIAHTHASFPIKAAQDMAFGTDVGKGTRISWYTDIGWMMGPWLIYGALINGATICIYDGAPDYPTPDRMWEFCARHKVEVLGISPTLIRSLARSGDTPVPIAGSSGESSSERRSYVHGDKIVPAPSFAPERKGWYRSVKLPHFDGEVTQFITFRLADSLPQGVLDRLKLQLEHDKLSDDSEEYRQRVDDYLDQGAGECILRRPEIAQIVAETILYEHERSCDLKAWVVMPNHAHLLLRMLDGHDLAGLMKRIKGVSARKINQHLGRDGSVWQADYFDRYIRDAEHFEKTIRYIENNPVAAGLVKSAAEWQFGSAWSDERSGDTPVPTDDASSSGKLVASSSVDGNAIVAGGTGDGRRGDTPVPMSAKHESGLAGGTGDGRRGDTPVPMSAKHESGLAGGTGDGRRGDTLVPMSAKHESGLAGGTGDGRRGDTLVPMSAKHESGLAGGTGDGDKSVPAPPHQRHDLSSLRIFASTGEPWNPAPWWWLFEKVGNSQLPIINYSGGTEIAGGILMGNPLLPIKPCSFPAPCPGMDVDIVDDDGNSVKAGKVGELVIKQPWIGMARGFWQEKERYLETYWRRFKNIWVHGDFAMRDKDGHWFILGRSDDTLKVAGKRVGPAEVESLLVAHPQVVEAAVIGVPDEVKGTAMIAFVVLSDGRSGDTPVPIAGSSGETVFVLRTHGDKSFPAPLEAELKALVAKDMGKPLAPSKIHFVSALPKTRNAKVMRRVIRSAYLGEDPGDLSALEDPTSIDAIRKANTEKRDTTIAFKKLLTSVPDAEPIHPDDVIK